MTHQTHPSNDSFQHRISHSISLQDVCTLLGLEVEEEINPEETLTINEIATKLFQKMSEEFQGESPEETTNLLIQKIKLLQTTAELNKLGSLVFERFFSTQEEGSGQKYLYLIHSFTSLPANFDFALDYANDCKRKALLAKKHVNTLTEEDYKILYSLSLQIRESLGEDFDPSMFLSRENMLQYAAKKFEEASQVFFQNNMLEKAAEALQNAALIKKELGDYETAKKLLLKVIEFLEQKASLIHTSRERTIGNQDLLQRIEKVKDEIIEITTILAFELPGEQHQKDLYLIEGFSSFSHTTSNTAYFHICKRNALLCKSCVDNFRAEDYERLFLTSKQEKQSREADFETFQFSSKKNMMQYAMEQAEEATSLLTESGDYNSASQMYKIAIEMSLKLNKKKLAIDFIENLATLNHRLNKLEEAVLLLKQEESLLSELLSELEEEISTTETPEECLLIKLEELQEKQQIVLEKIQQFEDPIEEEGEE